MCAAYVEQHSEAARGASCLTWRNPADATYRPRRRAAATAAVAQNERAKEITGQTLDSALCEHGLHTTWTMNDERVGQT